MKKGTDSNLLVDLNNAKMKIKELIDEQEKQQEEYEQNINDHMEQNIEQLQQIEDLLKQNKQ